MLDLTSDLGVPAFDAVSGRRERPEQITMGFGAHLDPRIAVLRAVTELNQPLLVLWWGSGRAGAGSGNQKDADPLVVEWMETASISDHPHLAPDPGQPARAASHFAGRWSEDLREDVRFCQALVERHGMEFLVHWRALRRPVRGRGRSGSRSTGRAKTLLAERLATPGPGRTADSRGAVAGRT